MTKEEILKKAILKAIKNGWKPVDYKFKITELEIFKGKWYCFENIEDMSSTASSELVIVEQVIFDPKFAKALWGEEKPSNTAHDFLPAWQYHLQRLVISEDRIKYLKKFI